MTHINLRRDTAANWTAENPVLQLGETGWETDTRKVKQGDGTTAWNALPYIVEPSVTSVNGQVGVVVLDAGDVGLGSVDNVPDANKPVSTDQQAALDLKAPLASPVFTGNPTAPTPTAGDADTSIATTEFVTDAIEAGASGTIRRKGTATATTNVTAADGVQTVAVSFTIPNPVNGRTYRVVGSGRFRSDTDGAATSVNLIHGSGATTSGTQFQGSGATGGAIDHRVAGRSSNVTFIGEFTFAGTTGESNYRIVMIFAGVGGESERNAAADRPTILVVDEIVP